MVENELLLPSYASLCTSPTLPSPEEGRRLTLETVLTLACARERILLRASERGCKTPTTASAPEDIVRAVVTELFDLTPHSNDPSVRVEGQVTDLNGKAPGGNSEVPEVVTVKQPNPSKKGKVNGVLASSELPPPWSPATMVSWETFMQRHALTDTVRTAQVARFVWSCSFAQMTHHLVYRENMSNSISSRRPSVFVRCQ